MEDGAVLSVRGGLSWGVAILSVEHCGATVESGDGSGSGRRRDKMLRDERHSTLVCRERM